jgi:hypothetical protein
VPLKPRATGLESSAKMMKSIPRVVWLVPAIILVIATARLPYRPHEHLTNIRDFFRDSPRRSLAFHSALTALLASQRAKIMTSRISVAPCVGSDCLI